MSRRVWVAGASQVCPALTPDAEPVDFKAELGRKGLRYKDEATKLALCATRDALEAAGLWTAAADNPDPDGLAVIVASNTGNIDTICKCMDELRDEGHRGLSPLDLPNASSNIISSSIAIRFGARSVNLLVSSGSASGIDALVWGARLIRARRARRVLVVGVEVRNRYTERLLGGDDAAALPPAHGAACVVLEDDEVAQARSVRPRVALGTHAVSLDERSDLAHFASLADGGRIQGWWTPPRARPEVRRRLEAFEATGQTPEIVDLSARIGEPLGLLGVLQAAAATHSVGDVWQTRALLTAGGYWSGALTSLLLEEPA